MPGFKGAKDQLILLGGNAEGHFTLKPIVVYHSEDPRAMKGFDKPNLPVIWHLNKKAWVTLKIFHRWFTTVFFNCCGTVLHQKYPHLQGIAHLI